MGVGGLSGIRTPCLAWGLFGLASRLNPHRACLCTHETIRILILILLFCYERREGAQQLECELLMSEPKELERSADAPEPSPASGSNVDPE